MRHARSSEPARRRRPGCTHASGRRRTHRAWPLVFLIAMALVHCSRAPGAQAGTASDAMTRAPAASRQESAMQPSTSNVVIDRLRAPSGHAISVSSPSVQASAAIPAHYTAYGDGVSPALQWTRVDGARAYALLVEDPDAKGPQPFVHWLAWNIPANVTSLPEGLQEQPRLTDPDGVLQGRNTRGSMGYYGPKPPVGDPAHHYHFQVYALDTVLDVPFGSDRDTLLKAMQGHVIGKGEVVGKYGQKQKPQK
jgi:Raf kinase inhibitor-like YbhB/YbcL family protein